MGEVHLYILTIFFLFAWYCSLYYFVPSLFGTHSCSEMESFQFDLIRTSSCCRLPFAHDINFSKDSVGWKRKIKEWSIREIPTTILAFFCCGFWFLLFFFQLLSYMCLSIIFISWLTLSSIHRIFLVCSLTVLHVHIVTILHLSPKSRNHV